MTSPSALLPGAAPLRRAVSRAEAGAWRFSLPLFFSSFHLKLENELMVLFFFSLFFPPDRLTLGHDANTFLAETQ